MYKVCLLIDITENKTSEFSTGDCLVKLTLCKRKTIGYDKWIKYTLRAEHKDRKQIKV